MAGTELTDTLGLPLSALTTLANTEVAWAPSDSTGFHSGQRENRTWSYPTLRFLIVVELSRKVIDNSAAGHGCSVPCSLHTNWRSEKNPGNLARITAVTHSARSLGLSVSSPGEFPRRQTFGRRLLRFDSCLGASPSVDDVLTAGPRKGSPQLELSKFATERIRPGGPVIANGAE